MDCVMHILADCSSNYSDSRLRHTCQSLGVVSDSSHGSALPLLNPSLRSPDVLISQISGSQESCVRNVPPDLHSLGTPTVAKEAEPQVVTIPRSTGTLCSRGCRRQAAVSLVGASVLGSITWSAFPMGPVELAIRSLQVHGKLQNKRNSDSLLPRAAQTGLPHLAALTRCFANTFHHALLECLRITSSQDARVFSRMVNTLQRQFISSIISFTFRADPLSDCLLLAFLRQTAWRTLPLYDYHEDLLVNHRSSVVYHFPQSFRANDLLLSLPAVERVGDIFRMFSSSSSILSDEHRLTSLSSNLQYPSDYLCDWARCSPSVPRWPAVGARVFRSEPEARTLVSTLNSASQVLKGPQPYFAITAPRELRIVIDHLPYSADGYGDWLKWDPELDFKDERYSRWTVELLCGGSLSFQDILTISDYLSASGKRIVIPRIKVLSAGASSKCADSDRLNMELDNLDEQLLYNAQEQVEEDSFVPIWSVDITSASPCWKTLPFEILLLIFQHYSCWMSENKALLPRPLVRKYLSRLSLTSSVIAGILRPLLFNLLCLKVAEDVRILSDIAQSARSKWLSSHITRLDLVDGCWPPPPLWTVVLSLLPSLRHLTLGGTTPNDRPSLFSLWRHRPTLRKLATLRTLHLIGFFIPSYSSLLRDLGAISRLEEVRLVRIELSPKTTTIAASAAGQRFLFASSLPRIRKLDVVGGAYGRSLSWIFASASLHHQYRMVNSRNGTQIGPVDGHVMLRIIDGLSEYGDTTAPLSFRCIEDSRDTYRFAAQFQDPSAMVDDINADDERCLRAALAIETQRLSQANDHSWPISRIFIAAGFPGMDPFMYLEGIPWHTFASEIRKLQSLDSVDIYCGTRHTKHNVRNRLSSLQARLSENLPGLTIRLHHSGLVPDGRHLAPDIFGLDPRASTGDAPVTPESTPIRPDVEWRVLYDPKAPDGRYLLPKLFGISAETSDSSQ